MLGPAVLAAAFVVSAWVAARVGLPRFDEAFLLYGLQQVEQGLVPTLDFQAYDVGRYYLLQPFDLAAGARGVFGGGHLLVALAALGVVASCRAVLGRRLSPALATVLTALLLAWGAVPRHKAADHVALLLLVAVFVHLFANPDRRRWALAGLVVGLVALIGRNHGMYGLAALGVAAVMVPDPVDARWHVAAAVRALANAALGVVLGWAPMVVLLLARSDFRDAYVDRLRRNVALGTNIPLPVPWPWAPTRSLLDPVGLGFVVLVAAAVVPLLLFAMKRSNTPRGGPLTVAAAAAAVGLPYLHHAFSRADLAHLAQATAPAIVVAVAAVVALLHQQRVVLGTSAAAALLVLVVHVTSAPARIHGDMVLAGVGVTERSPVEVDGRARLVSPADVRFLEMVRAIDRVMDADATVVALPREVGFYLHTGRQAPIPQLYLSGNTDSREQLAMVSALQEVDWVVLQPGAYGGNAQTEFVTSYPLVWDFLSNRCPEVLPPVVADQSYDVRRCVG